MDPGWLTVITARPTVVTQPLSLRTQESSRFQIHTYSKEDYLGTFVLADSDFGNAMPESAILRMVAGMSMEPEPRKQIFAREIR